MEFIHGYPFQQWAIQFVFVLFLIGGLVTLAVGLGLIVDSAGTQRFFVAMNRWVSTRRVFRPIEIPRDSSQAVQNHRRGLAVFFIAGAAFALYGLDTAFDAQAVSFVFGLDARPSSIASWLVVSARWVLIVGNLVAIATGIVLAFFPAALATLESQGGRWYSDRQLVKGADAMHLAPDRWVAASPRAAGWIITVAGLLLAGDFGIMLFGIR